MIKIPSYVGKSKIQGNGLFSGTDINAGSIVWQYEEKIDISISEEDVNIMLKTLPRQLSIVWHTYAFFGQIGNNCSKCWFLDGDNGRFMNHSRTPNTKWSIEDRALRSISEIKANEEITSNYSEWDQGPPGDFR